MKRVAAVLCSALLLSCVLTSCAGVDTTEETDTADQSRVELTKSGRIIEYTVEDFSEDYYDVDELEAFVEDEIVSYEENNKGRIKVKKERVRRGTAYLKLRYNSVDTYADFNGVTCFSGTIEEAQNAGYSFSMDFVLAQGEDTETANGEDSAYVASASGQITVPGSTVAADDSVKVLIIETDMSVTVPGEIQYCYCKYGQLQIESQDTIRPVTDQEAYEVNNLLYILYKK